VRNINIAIITVLQIALLALAVVIFFCISTVLGLNFISSNLEVFDTNYQHFVKAFIDNFGLLYLGSFVFVGVFMGLINGFSLFKKEILK
jgi:hypothetical protein